MTSLTNLYHGNITPIFPILELRALLVAYGQNAHSMALAVRADVELFRPVKREKDPDGEILGLIDLSR